MALFQPRCPVGDRERLWIDENTEWLRRAFGDMPRSAPVVVPTAEFFPPPFGGSDSDVRALTVRIAGYMGAEKEVGVDFTDDMQRDETMRRLVPGGPFHTSGAAGSANVHYSDSAAIITLDRSVIADPARLIAVIAHEIGHVRLMGERGVDSGRKDNEPLTDLATVYLGLGIFTANAAFDFSQRRTGWKARHLGYLTEQMFGYALARYTLLRGDPKPSWARHLDTNPRVYMKNAIRYLQHQSD
ncbi:MAG TPA: hypothetical protein VF060_31355 [Trebonia sp.]